MSLHDIVGQNSAHRPPVLMFLAKAFHTDSRPTFEANTLLEAGYPVFVLAWDRFTEFQPNDNVAGVIVRSFRIVNVRNSKFRLALGAIVFQIFLFLETLRLISAMRQKPVIHAHDFNTLPSACLLRVCRLSDKLVYDLHEMSYFAYSELYNSVVAGIVRTVEEKCLRYSQAIITVSDPIANYLREFNKSTSIIYNCAKSSDIPKVSRSEARIKLGLPVNSFVISYVGDLRHDCRADLLLSVASVLKDGRFYFLIVGGGPLAQQIEQRAAELQNAQVSVLPRAPREIALLYRVASNLAWVVFKKESLNARIGLPWNLSESLACGVPVIVENCSLRAQLVERKKCGLIINDDVPDHVSQIIMSLADDEDRYSKMRLAAKASSLDLNWETMSDRLTAIYAGLWPGKQIMLQSIHHRDSEPTEFRAID